MILPFRDRISALKKPFSWLKKRFVWRGERATEQMEARYTREAAVSLKESVQNLMEADDLSGKKLDDVIQARKEALGRRIAPLLRAAERYPDLTRQIQGIKTRVETKLQALKSRFDQALTRLGISDSMVKIARDQHEQFQRLINTFHQDAEQAETASLRPVTPPQTPTPQAPAQAASQAERAPSPQAPPSAPEAPVRAPVAQPRTAVPSRPPEPTDIPQRSYEMNEQFRVDLFNKIESFAESWAREGWISGGPARNDAIVRFAKLYCGRLTTTAERNPNTTYGRYRGVDAGYAFLADKMGGPNATNPNNELKALVREAYGRFEAYGRTRRDQSQNGLGTLYRNNIGAFYNQIRDEFFDGLSVGIDGRMSSTTNSVQQSLSRPVPSPASNGREHVRTPETTTERTERQRNWRRSVEQLPPALTRRRENELLSQLEHQVESGELPSPENLRRLQTLINRFQSEVLGTSLSLNWNEIRSARVYPAQYDQTQGRVTNPARLALGGRNITLHMGFEAPDDTIPLRDRRHTLVSVQHPDGHLIDVDAPRVLRLLQQLKDSFPEELKGQSRVDLSQLSSALENDTGEVLTRFRVNRVKKMLSSLGMSSNDIKQYENMPAKLAQLLRLDAMNERKSMNEWLEAVDNLVANNTYSQNDYRFLWLIRSLARTRTFRNDSSMSIENFLSAIGTATEYQRVPNTVTLVPFAQVQPYLVSFENQSLFAKYQTLQLNSNFISENHSFQEKIPALKALFEFNEMVNTMMPHTPSSPADAQSSWSVLVNYLDLAANIPVETGTAPNTFVVVDAGAPNAQMKIPKALVQRYQQLSHTNPFFRELVEIGRQAKPSGNEAPSDATLQTTLISLYTPSRTMPGLYPLRSLSGSSSGAPSRTPSRTTPSSQNPSPPYRRQGRDPEL